MGQKNPKGTEKGKGLTGTWINELGSSMTISVNGNKIEGTYTTVVSTKSCANGDFPLFGSTTLAEDKKSSVVAFTVAWKNAKSDCFSVTAWSGSYDVAKDKISAFWLLTSGVVGKQPWNSTLVGEDNFSRKPTTAQYEATVTTDLIKHPSHP